MLLRKVSYKYQKYNKEKRIYEDVSGKGGFHQFGFNFEEFDSGAGNYSTAIIELENGEIINPPVECVKFED